MAAGMAVLLALLVVSLHLNPSAGEWEEPNDVLVCPPWFLPDQNGSCVCGVSLNGAIRCFSEDASLAIPSSSCMTMNEALNTTVFGRCIYNPAHRYPPSYYTLPVTLNASLFNEQMCGPLNRKGRLCSQCKEGHVLKYPSAYSVKCSKCTNKYSGWITFIVVNTLPTTFIYFVVLALKIDINRPPIISFVAFNQVLYAMDKFLPKEPFQVPVIVQLVKSMYGLVSLHYFDEFLPPNCLHGIGSTFSLIGLRYIQGLYPLCLVVVTYVCIELHARNFRPFVILWRPFGWCFSKLRRTWQLQNSVLNALATMLTLSYVELILNIQFALFPLTMYTPTGRAVRPTYFFYTPYVQYFHGEHAAIALPTIIIALVLLLPVLLLLFYPFKWFQRLLEHLRLSRLGLRAFVDLFQGYFKNGSEGTREWRYFSALYFIIRIAIYMLLYNYPLWALSVPLIVIVILCVTRPYKKQMYNSMECVIFVYYTFYIYVLTQYMITPSSLQTFTLTFLYVLYSIPGVCFILYIVVLTVNRFQCVKTFMCHCRRDGSLTNLIQQDNNAP